MNIKSTQPRLYSTKDAVPTCLMKGIHGCKAKASAKESAIPAASLVRFSRCDLLLMSIRPTQAPAKVHTVLVRKFSVEYAGS